MENLLGEKRSAFLYEGRYYLLPDEAGSVAELMEKFGRGEPCICRELLSDKCMAPYFVMEHSRRQKLRLKHSLVFPVDVWVLSHEEYNERLRNLVEEHCPSCPHYHKTTSDARSLDGYHEEISLNRVCFMREHWEQQSVETARDYPRVNEWVQEFNKLFPTLELEKKLDEGQLEQAREIFEENLGNYVVYALPPYLMGRKEEGGYYIYFTTFFNAGDGLFMEYVCREMMKRQGKRGWDIRNYIPRGLYAAESEKPDGFVCEVLEYDHKFLDLTVCCANGQSMTGAYLWLCGLLGEDRLRNAAINYGVSGGELPGIRPPEELEAVVDACLEGLSQENIQVPPVEWIPYMEEGSQEMTGVTQDRCYNWHRVLLDSLAGEKCEMEPWEQDDILSELNMPLAVLTLPIPGESTADSPAFRKAGGAMVAFMDALAETNLAKVVFQLNSYRVMQLGFLVFNHTDFLYKVRELSPIFGDYFAKLDVFTASGKHGGHYAVSFDMPRLLGEQPRK